MRGRVAPMRDPLGRVLEWNAAFTDAHERHLAPARERNTADRSRKIFAANAFGACWIRRPDGSTAYLLTAGVSLAPDRGWRAVAVDVTQRKVTEQETEHRALRDALTGLPNRRLLVDRFEHALSRSRRQRHRTASRELPGVAVTQEHRDALAADAEELGDTFGGESLAVQVAGVDPAQAARGPAQAVLERGNPLEERVPFVGFECFVQWHARAAALAQDGCLLGDRLTLVARRLERGDHAVERVHDVSVVVALADGHRGWDASSAGIRPPNPAVTTGNRGFANGRCGKDRGDVAAGAGGPVESIRLAPEPGSIGAARRFVHSRLLARELDPSVAVLLTSELVTNVVRHARTQLTLVVRVDPRLRVEVHDGVAASDTFREVVARPPVDVPSSSPGGRGLGLVSVLASRFGLSDEPGDWNGKIVWFELDPPDGAERTAPR